MTDVTSRLTDAVRAIEEMQDLDRLADAVQPIVDRLTSAPAVKRILSGAPIGHRLHPMLTDVPIGCWTASTVLDLIAPSSGARSARRLVGVGIVVALPTAATGLSDWRDTRGGSRRLGVAHMAANTVALGFQIASWSARRRGHHVRGAVLGGLGLGVLAVGGYLGGHLVFAERVGVDVDVPVVGDEQWHRACTESDLEDGHPVLATVDGAPVVLVRRGSLVYALADTCSHAGGPLHEGQVDDDCIICPWHGSQFALDDGRVLRGPAAAPQPAYDVRLRDDAIEVRRVTPGTATRVRAMVTPTP